MTVQRMTTDRLWSDDASSLPMLRELEERILRDNHEPPANGASAWHSTACAGNAWPGLETIPNYCC